MKVLFYCVILWNYIFFLFQNKINPYLYPFFSGSGGTWFISVSIAFLTMLNKVIQFRFTIEQTVSRCCSNCYHIFTWGDVVHVRVVVVFLYLKLKCVLIKCHVYRSYWQIVYRVERAVSLKFPSIIISSSITIERRYIYIYMCVCACVCVYIMVCKIWMKV